MYQKNCYTCHRSSFSSSIRGKWLCPYCNQDLTEQRAFDPIVQQQVYQSLRVGEQARLAYRKNSVVSINSRE